MVLAILAITNQANFGWVLTMTKGCVKLIHEFPIHFACFMIRFSTLSPKCLAPKDTMEGSVLPAKQNVLAQNLFDVELLEVKELT